MTRSDLQELAGGRIAEAGVLLVSGRWDGAYYLAGYAVECGLKACVAKLTKPYDFPDKDRAAKAWTHKLDELLILAGLKPALDADAATDPQLGENWDTMKSWREFSRYDRKTEAEARALVDAVTDSAHGVLTWIRRHW